MKRLMSTALCVIIFTVNVIFVPYFTPVYAAGDVAGDVVKSIGFDTVVKFVKTIYSVGYNVATNGSGDGSAASSSLDNIWGEDSAINKWLQTELFPFMDANKNIDLTKENCPISYDKEKQLVEFNPTFTNKLSEQVQDKIHALDGYYLIEPAHPMSDFSPEQYAKKVYNICKEKKIRLGGSYENIISEQSIDSIKTVVNRSCALYVHYDFESEYDLNFKGISSKYSLGANNYIYFRDDGTTYVYNNSEFLNITGYVDRSSAYFDWGTNTLELTLEDLKKYSYGNPFRVFYSYQDLKNFLNNGKQRTYAPKLPSGGLKVPITYIQNNVNLPDLNINLDSLIGKAEADIQANIDLALKNYFDSLLEINNNPTKPTNPTPTPDGGFTDGTTPTPTPPITDGGDDSGNDKTDFSKITDLLQKILDKLTEFSSNHDTLAKTIIDYIEKNDGKLDEIIVAINALADGKTEEEKNGCKYDFTALSEFMTTLWNESDKKFDKMVELLEENNKYQQKLVNSLNEIKALLVTQTIMDLFKDRSSETANKAKDKFPTSIPWDIALVLNSMSAEPEQLKFSLPIKIDSFKINETIDIDLSSGEWEKLATTCRYILSITFILFLIHLSRKLFSNGGDE